MLPRFFHFARPRTSALSPLVRVAIVMLAIVQTVAPSWHVCQMGGYANTHHSKPQTTVWKVPSCGGGPKCICKREAFPPGTTFFSNRDECASNHCLARLLMGMPSQSVLPVSLALPHISRVQLAPAHPKYFERATFTLPPARGPPLLS